jgi:hypothetical protein
MIRSEYVNYSVEDSEPARIVARPLMSRGGKLGVTEFAVYVVLAHHQDPAGEDVPGPPGKPGRAFFPAHVPMAVRDHLFGHGGKLRTPEIVTGALLLYHSNGDGLASPSLELLTRKVLISPRVVLRAIDRLQALSYLKVDQRDDGPRVYRLWHVAGGFLKIP